MLQDLFSRSLPRLTASPHAADLDAFAIYLRSGDYCRLTRRRHVRHLYRVLGAVAQTRLDKVSDTELRSFFGRWPGKGYRGTERLFHRFLLDNGRLWIDTDCEPRLVLKQQYLDRLRDLRGLAPRTLTYINWSLTDFLTDILAPCDTAAAITADAIETYFRTRGPRLARRTFRHTVGAVRSFLRYAFEFGVLPEPLHRFELPRGFRFEQPPRALAWPQIEAMLVAIDRSTFVGDRDHAMLHLLAWYGLRPGEVASLAVNSIDWRASILSVYQSKTRSTLTLPLAPATIAVLREHLARRRASSHPQIFLCGQPPYGPMSCSLVTSRFKFHARRTGLPIASASAYALRHSFAMRLLRAGVGIEAIGDLMGHRNARSTSAYLRIQSDMLRGLALDVPGVGEQP